MPDKTQPDVAVRVAVLIQNGDRILLEKRLNNLGSGSWGPPIGHLEFGESFEQTAMRETEEETGIFIEDPKFRMVTSDVFEQEHEHSITIWMEARYVSGELKLNAPDEESNIGWFQWTSLPEPLFLPLRHVLEGQTYPSQTTEVKLKQVVERLKGAQT
jgi:8-oxo-dGTP diphosphatase